MSSPRLLLLLLALLAAPAAAQDPVLAVISVEAGSRERVETPILVSLEGIARVAGGIVLVEVTGGTEREVPAQILAGDPPRLAFVLEGSTPVGAVRAFELRRAGDGSDAARVKAGEPGAAGTAVASTATAGTAGRMASTDDGGAIRLVADGAEVLDYRYAVDPAPEGSDPLFARGGFIHPLRSPAGEELTRTRPYDHLHHMG